MPTIDLGLVKGDTGASMRMAGEWTANASYVNNNQYIDVVTNGGNSYSCKTSHTSGSTFSDTNWTMIAKKGDKGNKGDTGTTPTIQAGTATSLDATASPTVTSTTSGTTTTFNFGIPKGDTSKFETPTFMDTVNTYTTLSAANTAAETASNAIKSKVSIFTTLSNMKKSFSAIVQGLKILATNVGAINGITSDINSESTTIAASSKMVHDLNASLSRKTIPYTFNINATSITLTLIKRADILFINGRFQLKEAINMKSEIPILTISDTKLFPSYNSEIFKVHGYAEKNGDGHMLADGTLKVRLTVGEGLSGDIFYINVAIPCY